MPGDEVTLEGAVDLFVHCDPCVLPRLGSDLELAREAKAAGMRAIVTASHHESTVGRAHLVNRELMDFECYGGLALNGYVGGLNVQAAEAALATGGKFIWMPTYDAQYHASVMGGTGSTDSAQSPGRRSAGCRPSWMGKAASRRRSGKSSISADSTARFSAPASTGPTEIAALVDEAAAQQVPLVINHPFFILSAPLGFFREMVERGAWLELSALVIFTHPPHAAPSDFAELIRTVGAEHCVMGTDAGSQRHPRPTESLRVFGWRLLGTGIPPAALRAMLVANPARLLGLA